VGQLSIVGWVSFGLPLADGLINLVPGVAGQVTTCIVGDHFEWVLYDEPDGRGRELVLPAGQYANLDQFARVGTNTWNDAVQSIRIRHVVSGHKCFTAQCGFDHPAEVHAPCSSFAAAETWLVNHSHAAHSNATVPSGKQGIEHKP
jgi:hypothetical protein